jgi:hypothetical protein
MSEYGPRDDQRSHAPGKVTRDALAEQAAMREPGRVCPGCGELGVHACFAQHHARRAAAIAKLPAGKREAFEERAGIREFDGGQARNVAEANALREADEPLW